MSLQPVLDRLRERARRLEQEVAELRAELDRMAELLSHPVAVYEVEGQIILITEEDLAVVRAQLVKPRSEEVVRELALAYKIAERESMVAEDEIRKRIARDIEAIRAQAIDRGIAVDEPVEPTGE